MSGKEEDRFKGGEIDSLEQKLLRKKSKADEQLQEVLASPRVLLAPPLVLCWCACYTLIRLGDLFEDRSTRACSCVRACVCVCLRVCSVG